MAPSWCWPRWLPWFSAAPVSAAGPGGVVGVVVGALVLTFLANLLTGMGVAQPVQLVIQGGIIASAAALAIRRNA